VTGVRGVLPGAGADGPAARLAARGDAAATAAPVIVLTYPHAGVELLTEILSASRSLACTSATGLLPLCHEAITTWQQAEGRSGPPSSLALTSVRGLATSMITIILARAGASRWCETAFAGSESARTFLQVFPATRYLCLHRALQGVSGEAARAYPWGLGESPFWAFSGGNPGNNAATIATYWMARTEILLDFEAGHPASCLRLRYEDLLADRVARGGEVFAALGLDVPELAVLRERAAAAMSADSSPPVPADRIPPPLLARVHDAQARLGYDPWPE